MNQPLSPHTQTEAFEISRGQLNTVQLPSVLLLSATCCNAEAALTQRAFSRESSTLRLSLQGGGFCQVPPFSNCREHLLRKGQRCVPDAPSPHSITFHGELLDGAPLSSAAVRGKAEPADAPASSDTGTQHVIGIQVITSLRDQETSKYNPVTRKPSLNTWSPRVFKNALYT